MLQFKGALEVLFEMAWQNRVLILFSPVQTGSFCVEDFLGMVEVIADNQEQQKYNKIKSLPKHMLFCNITARRCILYQVDSSHPVIIIVVIIII